MMEFQDTDKLRGNWEEIFTQKLSCLFKISRHWVLGKLEIRFNIFHNLPIKGAGED